MIEKVVQEDGAWKTVETLPEKVLTVSGGETVEENITIGYRWDAEGVFYYRITEESGASGYLYDEHVFLVEVTVSDGAAAITGIFRDGVNADEVLFVNRAVTSLTVTKTIAGGSSALKFPFTAEVVLDGEPFQLPKPDESSGYTTDGNVISFSLGHGESMTFPCIPIGAVVSVEEHNNGDFLVFHELEGTDETPVSGAVREVFFANSPKVLKFTNQSGYRLPNTGGAGIIPYTAGGAAVSAAAMLYKRSRRNKRDK